MLTIRAAQRSKYVNRVVVSTEAAETAERAQAFGAEVPFLRSPELARDYVSTDVVLADVLRALEGALEEFAGCVVVISHDRWFLNRIATHILAFEGDSHVEWFQGNFQDYEEDKKRRLGEAAVEPHRIRYRKLTR